MIIPNITIEQLLEAGVHLGHKTLRWNPKMKKYIFGRRDTIHIIDLTQTVELIKQALEKVYETISNRGKIFVLGMGSNVLFRDSIYDGVVIKLGNNFSSLSKLKNDTIIVGSSCSQKKFSNHFDSDNQQNIFSYLLHFYILQNTKVHHYLLLGTCIVIYKLLNLPDSRNQQQKPSHQLETSNQLKILFVHLQ